MAKVTAKAARKLKAHTGSAVLSGKLSVQGKDLILAEAGLRVYREYARTAFCGPRRQLNRSPDWGDTMARPRRERVAVNVEIPHRVWEKYHQLCRTRYDVSLHELLLALLNRTVNRRLQRDQRRRAAENFGDDR